MSIKKITVEIGGNEVVLTMDEARKLFLDLSELFAKPPVQHVPYWSGPITGDRVTISPPTYLTPTSACDERPMPTIVTCSAGDLQ